jgi:hypothetical protein
MKYLTKKIKLEILEQVLLDYEAGLTPYMCIAVADHLEDKLLKRLSMYNIQKKFNFLRFKPEDVYYSEDSWFPKKDVQSRIKIVKQLIAELKTKTKP